MKRSLDTFLISKLECLPNLLRKQKESMQHRNRNDSLAVRGYEIYDQDEEGE